ncbi:hypothetical protein [Pseudomonas sp. CGJS7]|uniref:hypothetical protein n=1 Tax=Pseudomonas sp. CGJS7 TaxID=3109348 RepID=UPI003009A496
MKIITLVCPILLAFAVNAHAQSEDAARAELQQAATGESFRIGYSQFRLIPTSVVAEAKASSKSAASGKVRVGPYTVGAQTAKAATGAKAAAAKPKLMAAMSDDGRAVVVTSTLEVYHRNVSALKDAAKATGGKLTYSSEAGGNGRIEFASVAEAMAAMPKILGISGIKDVAPEIIQGEDRQM